VTAGRAAAALATLFLASPAAAGPVAGATHFVCDVGPAVRNFGGAQWLVYSCGDGRTLLFEGAPSGAADRLYFEVSFDQSGVQLGGRSADRTNVTDAAFKDVAALAPAQRSALLAATEAAPSKAR
jgi:hypothetical protein